ncbi:MAG: Gfo/Idh/MocA family oxidoreductase [Planctomycetes bacterium]|nr:Gfo/Idh/MocA family oxidoreductase [Planctomycetota bacterium]
MITCAVIGLGMGRGHAKAYSEHKDAKLVAVVDTDRVRAEAATKEFGCKAFADAAAMLAEMKPDIVSVAVPNAFHAPLAIQALEAGAHVLCEKPMAMTAAEGREMLAAAAKAKRRLMINFSYRFSPATYFLKQQVDTGVLGKVYAGRTVWHRRRGLPGFGGWFGQKKLSGGGPLIDLGVHRLDLALWLMGHPKPRWVLANTFDPIASRLAKQQGKAYDCEDSAFAMIRFEDGAMLEVEASWAINQGPNEFMETRLYGTEGGLIQHNVGEGYDFTSSIHLERQGVPFDLTPHPPIPAVTSAYHHFVESIRDGKPHSATGEEGLLVMEILDAIYASAERGEPVRIG